MKHRYSMCNFWIFHQLPPTLRASSSSAHPWDARTPQGLAKDVTAVKAEATGAKQHLNPGGSALPAGRPNVRCISPNVVGSDIVVSSMTSPDQT